MRYLDTPVTIVDDGTDRSLSIKFAEPSAGDTEVISGVLFRTSHDTSEEIQAKFETTTGCLNLEIPNNLINYTGYAKIVVPKSSFLSEPITVKFDVYSPKDEDGADRGYTGADKYLFVRDFHTNGDIYVEVGSDVVNTDFLRSVIDKVIANTGLTGKDGVEIDTVALKNDILNRVIKSIDTNKIQNDVLTAVTAKVDAIKEEQSKSVQNQDAKIQAVESKVAGIDVDTIKTNILSEFTTKTEQIKAEIINAVDIPQLKLDLTGLVETKFTAERQTIVDSVTSAINTKLQSEEFINPIVQRAIAGVDTHGYADTVKTELNTKIEENTTGISGINAKLEGIEQKLSASISEAILKTLKDTLTSEDITTILKKDDAYVTTIWNDIVTAGKVSNYLTDNDLQVITDIDNITLRKKSIDILSIPSQIPSSSEIANIRSTIENIKSEMSKSSNGDNHETAVNSTNVLIGHGTPYASDNVNSTLSLPVGGLYIDSLGTSGVYAWIKKDITDPSMDESDLRSLWESVGADSGPNELTTKSVMNGSIVSARRVDNNVTIFFNNIILDGTHSEKRVPFEPGTVNRSSVIVAENDFVNGLRPEYDVNVPIMATSGLPLGRYRIGSVKSGYPLINVELLRDIANDTKILDTCVTYTTNDDWISI